MKDIWHAVGGPWENLEEIKAIRWGWASTRKIRKQLEDITAGEFLEFAFDSLGFLFIVLILVNYGVYCNLLCSSGNDLGSYLAPTFLPIGLFI